MKNLSPNKGIPTYKLIKIGIFSCEIDISNTVATYSSFDKMPSFNAYIFIFIYYTTSNQWFM